MHARTALVALVVAACAPGGDHPKADITRAPGQPPRASAAPNDSLDRTVAGIAQDITDGAARRIAGRPDSASAPAFSEMIGDTIQTLYYRDLEIELVAHRVDGVTCRRAGCATGRGVRVGDPASAVTRVYGRGEHARGDDGESIVYRDANACGMAFDLAEDRVRVLHVFCDHN